MTTREELLQQHTDLCKASRDLMKAKNHDYADQNEVFGNLRMCEHLSHGEVPTSLGILVRLTDKLARLYNFERHGRLAVVDESVEDTVLDIINYVVLYRAAHRSTPPASGGEGVSQGGD